MPRALLPPALVAAWLLTCSAVAAGLDYLATRPAEVYVEGFRQAGMTDDQVLSEAVQAAQRRPRHWWWVRTGPTHLAFEPARAYDLDAGLLRAVRHSAPELLAHLPARSPLTASAY